MDLSVNKPAQDFVRAKFRDWYDSQICKQLDDDLNEEVDMRMINLHAYQSSWPSIIINGFRAAGLKDYCY